MGTKNEVRAKVLHTRHKKKHKQTGKEVQYFLSFVLFGDCGDSPRETDWLEVLVVDLYIAAKEVSKFGLNNKSMFCVLFLT